MVAFHGANIFRTVIHCKDNFFFVTILLASLHQEKFTKTSIWEKLGKNFLFLFQANGLAMVNLCHLTWKTTIVPLVWIKINIFQWSQTFSHMWRHTHSLFKIRWHTSTKNVSKSIFRLKLHCGAPSIVWRHTSALQQNSWGALIVLPVVSTKLNLA